MDIAGTGVQCARQARTQARAGPAPGCGRDAVHLPHRLPVAVPPGIVRTLDASVVAVSPLDTQRCQTRHGGRRDRAPGRCAGRAGLHPREPGERTDAGTRRGARGHCAARAGLGGPRSHRSRCPHARPAPRPRGAQGRWGRQAAGVPSHPACLASRGRPRSPGTRPPVAKSFEKSTTSATGWLQVACVATAPRASCPAPERGNAAAPQAR